MAYKFEIDVSPQYHFPAAPPRSSELNPVENVWQVMRNTGLSNRLFKTYGESVSIASHTGNHHIHQPSRLISLELRKGAQRS